MGAREWGLDQLRKLWRLASEVLKFEVDLKWLDSIYEDDNIRDEEKTRNARVRFLKLSFELSKQEKIVKTLIDDANNGYFGNRGKEEGEASEGSSDSKGNDV